MKRYLLLVFIIVMLLAVSVSPVLAVSYCSKCGKTLTDIPGEQSELAKACGLTLCMNCWLDVVYGSPRASSFSLGMSPPTGTVVLLNADETETTGNVTKTYSLASNTYSKVMVEMDWELASSANTICEWVLAIEIPSGIIIHDSNIRIDATGSNSKNAGSYKASAVCTSASTLTVRMTPIIAGNAIAKILNMRVYGVY